MSFQLMTKPSPHTGRHVVSNLKVIGVPESMFPRGHGGFWRRGGEPFYLAILEKARDLFRMKIRLHFENGVFTKAGIALIAAWSVVKSAFRERGWELA